MKTYKFEIPIIPHKWDGDEEILISVTHKICQIVVDDFNDADLKQYLRLSFKLIKLYAKTNNNKVFIFAETIEKLSDKQIKELADEITGQCSDGWGEGLEQQEQMLEFKDDFIYISTWESGKECKYIGEIE